jgi:hypothetical protein
MFFKTLPHALSFKYQLGLKKSENLHRIQRIFVAFLVGKIEPDAVFRTAE